MADLVLVRPSSRFVLVRPAKRSDAEAIAEVHVATWRAAYRGQVPDAVLDTLDISARSTFWREALSGFHRIFVAESDSVVVGFCSLIPSRDAESDSSAVAEIAALYVLPEHWRCGAGRALCSTVFSAAVTAGFSSIILWVLTTNSLAIRFYEAQAFQRDGATKSE
ncbi:MAG: GNAT family N-acetyltransferase, partial [Bryobacteraceae bacterium]